MPLSFKLFNRFLLGQKNPEYPLESCRTQDVLSVCEGSIDGQPIKDPGHTGLDASQQIIGNNWSQIKNLYSATDKWRVVPRSGWLLLGEIGCQVRQKPLIGWSQFPCG